MQDTMRLDKCLADAGIGTRTEVKQMIRKGQVVVNGEIVKKVEQKVNPDTDCIVAAGKEISYQKDKYIMLHKPAGVISATEDSREQTVLTLLPKELQKDLFPVGRLDKDTEGLLLLTNDGDLAHQLLSPKKHVDKTYFARVQGVVTADDQKAFLEGVDIGDEKITMPAKLEILKSGEASEILLTIQEGRFHQVKRMFEAVGKKVVYLKRMTMGSLILDETLPLGAYRLLTEEEILRLKRK